MNTETKENDDAHGPFTPPPSPRPGDLPRVPDGYERGVKASGEPRPSAITEALDRFQKTLDYRHATPEVAPAFLAFKADQARLHRDPASVISFAAGWNAAKGSDRSAELLGQAVEMIDAGIALDSSFAWVEQARPFARFREAK